LISVLRTPDHGEDEFSTRSPAVHYRPHSLSWSKWSLQWEHPGRSTNADLPGQPISSSVFECATKTASRFHPGIWRSSTGTGENNSCSILFEPVTYSLFILVHQLQMEELPHSRHRSYYHRNIVHCVWRRSHWCGSVGLFCRARYMGWCLRKSHLFTIVRCTIYFLYSSLSPGLLA
jgi:hypothetical protein